MNKPAAIYIGFDPREAAAFAVCRDSIKRHLSVPIPIYGIVLDDMRKRSLYYRPTEVRETADEAGNVKRQLWDSISDAPMSTEFSVSRFLTPILAREGRGEIETAGWALFMDCDMLVRDNLARLFDLADDRYAVMCVKHRHEPPLGTKMDGQLQVQYARKNWSSFCLFNCDHPANRKLTVEMVNSLPGRDLHRFCWLSDDQIGDLSPEWNWLVGHNAPKVIHFTEGMPFMPGYENSEYANDWREAFTRWAL